ncbi:hypothetical protein [Brevundimonas sp. NIBR11]|uniref:hypothetical protein n=1 Tax=Brevundimonas sp. NIBR11 TaxID=3015999 RepID=UPI0022EFED47|nr:hypothetical protein [Brevundimonas sp. NIBR11]WGM32530.1 hypothetical protein KKHFBJBL_02783 [Brevundimonas sp. NIBR11]
MPGLLVLAAAALMMTGARAQTAPAPDPVDLISTLNSVCVAAQGDRARAAELAAEAGYSPVPESMVPRLRNSSDRAGFMRSNAADMSIILTGRINRRVGREDVVMEFCGVSARPTDHRALNARLREAMGFERVRGAGLDAYAWLQTPEGRAPSRSLSDAQFIAMAATGQMRLVGIDQSGNGSTLMYFLPRLD